MSLAITYTLKKLQLSTLRGQSKITYITGKLIRAKSERQTFNMQLEKLSMEEKGKGKKKNSLIVCGQELMNRYTCISAWKMFI